MSCSASSWVDSEFEGIDLGDGRLNQRFKLIAIQLAKQCGKTLASSFAQWQMIKASYRFFANNRFNEQDMLAPHIMHTVNRIQQHSTVLILQDTTYLDYNNHPKTQGLDLTFRSKLSKESEGLIPHNTLAVTDKGVPLALIDQTFINRKAFAGKSHGEKRKIRNWNRPIEEKESRRWIDVVRKCNQLDFAQTETVHVADRECDIYEFFRNASEMVESFLIRASKNRSINKRNRRELPLELLFDYLKAKRAQRKTKITIQVNGKKKYRDAELSIVYRPITMPPPPNKTANKDGTNLPMVPLCAIMAFERKPPKNEAGIFWVLLTNLDVNSIEQAIEKIRWYSLRWNIELYYKVLKSGCGVEDAQLRHADRLKKYIVLKSIIAWRLFWLSRAYEENSEGCCSAILSETEWKILFRKINKTRVPPGNPPTIGEACLASTILAGEQIIELRRNAKSGGETDNSQAGLPFDDNIDF